MIIKKEIVLAISAVIGAGGLAWFFISRNSAAPVQQVPNTVPEVKPAAQFISDIVDNVVKTTGVAVPRGIRNNNPLNIKWNSVNNWDGQTGKDSGGYATFSDALYGIRAAAKLLKTYRGIGVKTVRAIVTRWTSGDASNIVNNYIAHCAKILNISESAEVSPLQYAALIAAMIKFENGQQPYSVDTIAKGVQMAGV